MSAAALDGPAPKEEFKRLRATLAALVQALKGLPIPKPPAAASSSSASSALETALALAPQLQRACAPFYEAVPDQDTMPQQLRVLLLERLWCPLLARVLFLAHTLTPPQGHAPQPPGRSGGTPPAGMFSMLDFNHLRTALEILVLWGVYPCLDEGVGQALDRRPESKAVQVPPVVLVWGYALGEKEADSSSRYVLCGLKSNSVREKKKRMMMTQFPRPDAVPGADPHEA